MAILTSNFLVVSLCHNTKRKNILKSLLGNKEVLKVHFRALIELYEDTAATTIKQNDSPEKFALLTLILSFKFLLK